jgi:hypothetical protein
VDSTRVRRAPTNSGGGGSGGGDGEATPLKLTQETEQDAESGDAETSPLSLTTRPDSQVEAARVEHRLEHESHILDAPANRPVSSSSVVSRPATKRPEAGAERCQR